MSDQCAVFEVASGQVYLDRRRDFARLHTDVFAPVADSLGIQTVALLMVEVGRFGRFLDVYRYPSMCAYEALSAVLERRLIDANWYPRIQKCVSGSISLELAYSFEDLLR